MGMCAVGMWKTSSSTEVLRTMDGLLGVSATSLVDLEGGDGPLKLRLAPCQPHGVHMHVTSGYGLRMGDGNDLVAFRSNGQVRTNLSSYTTRMDSGVATAPLAANALCSLQANEWHILTAMEIFH